MHTEGPRLRVALVGAGLVGQAEHAFHLWEERERFELAAVVDASETVRAGRRRALRGARARRRPWPTWTPRASTRSSSPLPDAVHRDAVVDALGRGLHVFCEKPLALSAEECDDIEAAAEASGTRHAGRLHEAPRPVRAAARWSGCPRRPPTSA